MKALDCRGITNFKQVIRLYKKSFQKQELINSKNFHQYAYQKNIVFKVFYEKEKLIGFIKGFIKDEILFISFFASTTQKNKKLIFDYIKKHYMDFVIILIPRNEDETNFYTNNGFKVVPNLIIFLKRAGYTFVSNKIEKFNGKKVVDGIKENDWPLMFKSKEKVEIYASNVQDLTKNNKFDRYYKVLNIDRKEKVDRYAFEKDKLLSLGVWVLLKKALSYHHLDINNYELKYEENGKPYLKDCPYKFSLSHSGNYVVVALSKVGIGVDIEKVRDIDFKIKNQVANELDELYYSFNNNKLEALFESWVIKESYLKYTGEGISSSINQLYVNYYFMMTNGIFSYLLNNIDGYKIGVATPIYTHLSFKVIKL